MARRPEPEAEPDPDPPRQVTEQELKNMKSLQREELCRAGFYFIPGANFEDGVVEGDCPHHVRDCICRKKLLCQWETEYWESDSEPLRWSCGTCRRWLLSTTMWPEIKQEHASHVCTMGSPGRGASVLGQTPEHDRWVLEGQRLLREQALGRTAASAS